MTIKNPIIIACPHIRDGVYSSFESLEKIKKLALLEFRKIISQKKPRTVFVEGQHENIVAGYGYPFDVLVEEAKKNGIRIIYLDSQKERDWSEMFFYAHLSKGIQQHSNIINEYYSNNLREKIWAEIASRLFRPGDIFVMHPGHVSGFLRGVQSKWSRIIRVDKKSSLKRKRLSEQQLCELKKLLKLAKKQGLIESEVLPKSLSDLRYPNRKSRPSKIKRTRVRA